MDIARLSALHRRIAQLEIVTKKLLSGGQAGQYITRRIGTGSEFDELRDYQVGDNVRSIDWKSSARSNKLIVRSYREDRNRSFVLLVDISRSGMFASGKQLKSSVVEDIAVMITFAAEQARDRVGAVFFHQSVEKTIPLGSGKKQSALLAHEILTAQSISQASSETSLSQAFEATLKQFPKNALVVLISDCMSSEYETMMTTLSQHHELVIVRVYDPIERDLPEGILIECEDPESGLRVDGNDPAAMAALRAFTQRWHTDQELLFKKLGVDYCDININTQYDARLIKFFAQRCL